VSIANDPAVDDAFARSMPATARTRGRYACISCFTSAPWNPYLGLLYEHLDRQGVRLAEEGRLSLRWLWHARSSVGFLHLHWPEALYRFERGPALVRSALGWLKLVLLASRLAAARALGYRLVWTIHQVFPHEVESRRRERIAGRLLARACHLLLAHDHATAEAAAREYGLRERRVEVVPHGSYVDVYPPGRKRSAVRAELGIPEHAFVFIAFGELRGYKGIELLLEAWADARLPSASLVIAGHPKDPAIAEAVRSAAAADPRIKPLLVFRPHELVAELFGASDAAVIARTDGGTSGSLILALSLGLPVVLADVPAYHELTQGHRAGWLFRRGAEASLREALEAAAADPAEAYARGRVAREVADTLRWPEIATRTAALLQAVMPQPR
jgi:glycosyltransferase involved in cell wall biosynthesis